MYKRWREAKEVYDVHSGANTWEESGRIRNVTPRR